MAHSALPDPPRANAYAERFIGTVDAKSPTDHSSQRTPPASGAGPLRGPLQPLPTPPSPATRGTTTRPTDHEAGLHVDTRRPVLGDRSTSTNPQPPNRRSNHVATFHTPPPVPALSRGPRSPPRRPARSSSRQQPSAERTVRIRPAYRAPQGRTSRPALGGPRPGRRTAGIRCTLQVHRQQRPDCPTAEDAKRRIALPTPCRRSLEQHRSQQLQERGRQAKAGRTAATSLPGPTVPRSKEPRSPGTSPPCSVVPGSAASGSTTSGTSPRASS